MLELEKLPLIVENFTSKEDCEEIVKWANFAYGVKHEVMFIKSGRNRAPYINVPDVVYKNADKVMDEFDLRSYESTLDVFVNRHEEGGQVFPHVHTPKWCGWNGYVDLRINLLVSKPHKGGVPIVENKEYEINEGDLIIFDAAEDHSTDIVEGDKDRYLISYGFYCLFDEDGKLTVSDGNFPTSILSTYGYGQGQRSFPEIPYA
jgi:hypothetical protein